MHFCLYKDNAASWKVNFAGLLFFPSAGSWNTISAKKISNILMKVETHNHQQPFSPFSVRKRVLVVDAWWKARRWLFQKQKQDECVTRILTLKIPVWQLGELPYGNLPRMRYDAFGIINDRRPYGVRRFNNEFGRPNLLKVTSPYFEQKFQAQSQRRSCPRLPISQLCWRWSGIFVVSTWVKKN